MKGEGQLINLMHCRYMDALQDMVSMLGGDAETLAKHIELANKLSTINVNNYCTKWGKPPHPQKKLELSTEGNIVLTNFYPKTD